MNVRPIGKEVGVIANVATSPPPSVGYMLTVESLPTMYVPFPYAIIASGSLIVKLKYIFLVPPSLLTCKLNIVEVRFTMGVPQIVPFNSPKFKPSGRAGTTFHETIEPFISVGTMETISKPLSKINSVWSYVTVGLLFLTSNETINC